MIKFTIKIHSVTGLPVELTRKYSPGGNISVFAELANTRKALPRRSWGSWGSTIKNNEVIWPGNQGKLEWEMNFQEWSHIKATHTKIKLNIRIHHDDKVENIGMVLLDLRDDNKNAKWNKVHGMPGAEIQVSSYVINISSSMKPSERTSASKFGEGSHFDDMATTESQRKRIAISISLDSCRHLDKLIPEANQQQNDGIFWMSWNLFGQQFQSEEIEFSRMKYGPSPVRDILKIHCTLDELLQKLYEEKSLNIFLVTTGRPIAKAEIPLLSYSGLPVEIDDWFDLVSPFDTSLRSSHDPPAVKFNLSIYEDLSQSTSEYVSTPTPTATASGTMATNTALSSNDVERKKNETSEQLERDQNGDGLDVVVTTSTTSEVEEGSNHEDDDYGAEEFEEDIDKKSNNHISEEMLPVASNSMKGNIRILEHKHQSQSNSNNNKGYGDDTAPETTTTLDRRDNENDANKNDDEEEDDDEDEDALRHYRLSVEVRSITGLKAAAHICVQFAYPFIGVGAHVRTHPVWVLPHVMETKIDGASAIFECCLSHASLSDTLLRHPMMLSVLTKSNLGSDELGQAAANLEVVSHSKCISFRCPVTSKTFKSRIEYSRHRKMMLKLKVAGRLVGKKVPPIDCISIRAWDISLPVFSKDKDLAGRRKEAARIRFVAVLEDLGGVGVGLTWPVKPGYKMHNCGVYEQNPMEQNDTNDDGDISNPVDPLEKPGITAAQRAELEALKLDWEVWRKASETQWRESLKEKENQLRRRLEAEAAGSLSERADDLRRAHEEAARLEVRLRSSLDAVERQKAQLHLKEEQATMKLAQRTAELQLLQKRVREEAKAKVEVEERRVHSLELQIRTMQETLERAEKRAKEAEREYDSYRQQSRIAPENLLREETARLRAQLAESKVEVERERRLRGEAELEKEHFRAQVHRLALALKREREKSAVLARQDMEQLRLEFLAREERYILDGDRDELRRLRNAVTTLNSSHYELNGNTRAQSQSQTYAQSQSHQPFRAQVYSGTKNGNRSSSPSSPSSFENSKEYSNSVHNDTLSRLRQQREDLIATGLYDENDELLQELSQAILETELRCTEEIRSTVN
eukprot:gene886-1720_t